MCQQHLPEQRRPSQSASSTQAAYTVDLNTSTEEEDDPHLNPPQPKQQRWKPSLRKDSCTDRTVLCLNSTGSSAHADGPKGSIAQDLPPQRRRGRSKTPDTRQGGYQEVSFLVGTDERTVNFWIPNTDFSLLENIDTNSLYEKLYKNFGDLEARRQKPGVLLTREDALNRGLVTRVRTMPEGAIDPETATYTVPAPPLQWPERFRESLPILPDPYCRAAYLSKHTASWESLTKGYVDQLVQYNKHNFPISRPPEEVRANLAKGHSASTLFFSDDRKHGQLESTYAVQGQKGQPKILSRPKHADRVSFGQLGSRSRFLGSRRAS